MVDPEEYCVFGVTERDGMQVGRGQREKAF